MYSKHEMETCIEELINKDEKQFTKVLKRRYGLNIDWYSDTYGRILISGKITYEAERNFRCGETFDKYKIKDNINKTCLIVIICCTDYSPYVAPMEEIKDFKQFMAHQKFEKPDIFMIGKKIENPEIKSKKKNRKQRFFRNKQFYIHTNEFIVNDKNQDVNLFVEERITFDCIFRNIPTETDSMLP